MKKSLILTAVIAAIIITSGISFAAREDTKKKPTTDKRTLKTQPSQADILRQKTQQRRPMPPMNPEDRNKRFNERYTEELKKAKEGPESTIRELTAIKGIAKKEKAKKTVEAIEKLIVKTQKQLNQRVKVIEERQAKFKEFLEKRGSGPQGPTGRQPRKPGTRTRPSISGASL